MHARLHRRLLLGGFQNEVELRCVEGGVNRSGTNSLRIVMPLEVHDQRLLDSKHRVVFKEGITLYEQMRCERLIAGRGHDEVDVRRSPVTPSLPQEELTNGAIRWHRIAAGDNRPEGVLTVRVRCEDPPEGIRRKLLRLLNGIEPPVIGLPYIQHRGS